MSALTALSEEPPPEAVSEAVDEMLPEFEEHDTPPAPEPVAVYTGPERRVSDRREGVHGFFGAGERRAHPFGRRSTDRVFGKVGP